MNNELEKGKGQRINKEVKHGVKGLGWRRDSGKTTNKKKTQKMKKSIEEIINISFPNKTFIRQLLNQEIEPNIHHTENKRE